MADSYVCSGATMICTMGSQQAKLTVLPNRTVFLCQKPLANISDHISMVNLAPFGVCRSLAFPATAAATAAALGTLTPMPCIHNTPTPWMPGKPDYLVQNQPALLKSCKCQCIWGGTISIIEDGQSNTTSVDLSRKERRNNSLQKIIDLLKDILQSEKGFIVTPSLFSQKSDDDKKREEASKLVNALWERMKQVAPKTINKLVEELNNRFPSEEKNGGNNIITIPFGGMELATIYFKGLEEEELINVKDKEYPGLGKGWQGYNNNNLTVILRPGSTTGPVTMEIQKKLGKRVKTIYEIRFGTPIEDLIKNLPLDSEISGNVTSVYHSNGGPEKAVQDFKKMGLKLTHDEIFQGNEKPFKRELKVNDVDGNEIVFNPGNQEESPIIQKIIKDKDGENKEEIKKIIKIIYNIRD